MIESFIISVIAIFLAFIAKYEKYKFCLHVAFILITIFLSVGFEWGNDVTTYQILYDRYIGSNVSLLNISILQEQNEKNEFGWVFLNILFEPLGFYGFRAILFCFENYVIFRLVKNKVAPKWYWLALVIYTINPNYMILSSSMMRQWLAMCIIIFAFSFLEKKKVLIYLLLVLSASTIHRSSLICLPLVILPYIKMNLRRESLIWIIPVFAIYFISSSFVVNKVVSLLNSEDIYSNYSGSNYNSGIGIVSVSICILYLIMILYLRQIQKRDIIYISVLSLCILILPLYTYSGLASRLVFYYSVFSICAFPIFIDQIRSSKMIKYIEMYGIILYSFYNLFIFWTDPSWIIYFGIYRNIFEEGILKF